LTKKSKKRKLALTHSALVHKQIWKASNNRLFNPHSSPSQSWEGEGKKNFRLKQFQITLSRAIKFFD
jgi:hypothetical protein